MTSTGTPTVTMGVDILDGSGNYITVNNPQVTTLFGLAECQCNVQNYFVRAQVTNPLPVGSLPAYAVWAGSSCDVQGNQVANQTSCEQLTGGDVTTQPTDFQSTSNVFPRQKIPVQALASPFNGTPKPTDRCTGKNISSSLYFLFGTVPNFTGNSSITLPVNAVPPSAPTIDSAASGDGAVTINWTVAIANQPAWYQILCADMNGNPVPGLFSDKLGSPLIGYSACVNGTYQQRTNLQTGGGTGTGTDDAGVISDGYDLSFGFSSAPLNEATLSTDSDPLDAGVAADGGVADGGASGTDGGVPEAYTVFGGLDQKFVCSALLNPNTNSNRIEGLTNNTTYQFTVVGIDLFGNPAPSAVLTAKPQPVEDVYRRFRDEGGAKQGFCFIATAAYGSYESPYVQVLRDFRDRELLPTGAGRAFVEWYYRHSPPAAAFIARHETARFATQEALRPVILFALLWMALAAWQKALLFTLAVGVASRRRLLAALRGRA